MITFALLLQLLGTGVAHAQTESDVTVKGRITDPSGEPLIGVNIMAAKAATGTITDMEGNFTIVVPKDDELSITYVGFKEQKIPVEGRIIINVTMEEGTSDLEEVVVVGYGTVKRANLVGSVSSVKAEELEDYPTSSLTNLLDGKMPGVSLSPRQPTGRPGAQTSLRIRGQISFGTANSGVKEENPLYVVDGFIMEQEAFDLLDPSEIESISVLKDASAAVYGARGANGVVLVKTKRGKPGKARITYSGSYGIGDATQQTDMLSAYDQARMVNAANRYDSDFTRFTDEELEEMKSLDYNWLEDAWKMSSQEKHAINISGGTDRVNYFGSGTYVKENGNFDNLGVLKYSYRMGIDAKLTDELSVSATLSIDNKEVNIPYIKSDGIGNTMEKTFQRLLETPRWIPYRVNGKLVYPNFESTGSDEDADENKWNPFALFETNSYKLNTSKGNTVNLSATYEIPQIKGLVAQATYSRRENHNYGKFYLESYNLYQFKTKEGSTYLLSDEVDQVKELKNSDRIYESYDFGKSYQLNASLTYSKKVDLHDLKLFATYEQTEDEGFDFSASAEQQILSGLDIQPAFENDGVESVTDGGKYENGRISGIGRLNYSYANKYLFESTLRMESSTKFDKGERLGFFPSFAFGWVASEEPFIKEKLYNLNFLKLRTSFGRTGIDYSGSYEYRLQYGSADSYLFGNSPTGGISVQNSGMVASGVTWEKNDMYNGGLDVRLWDSKLGITLDAFYNYSYDILFQRDGTFPFLVGIDEGISENLGRLEAWGYDMQIEYNGKIGNDFSWKVAGVFSFNTNRYLELDSEYDPDDWRYEVGKSTYAAAADQGYITEGVINTQEELDAILEANPDYTIFGVTPTLGMLYFKDIARPGNTDEGEPEIVYEPDGEVTKDVDVTFITDTNDKLVWKNLLPTSLSFGGKYKNWSMSTQFNLAWGVYSDIYDKAARSTATASENAPAFWSDYWAEDNLNAKYPDPYWSELNELPSTFWVKDVYQLRLRNLNISYKLPADITNKWGFTSMRVFFVGENLWTPISTFDYKEDAISRYNTYPFLKTFNFGVNVSL